jgi:hypothetical protein
MRQPGVEPGAKAWEASMLPIHHWRPSVTTSKVQSRNTKKGVWRSGVSIPVPADCEPTALPSELHPHVLTLAGSPPNLNKATTKKKGVNFRYTSYGVRTHASCETGA